MRYRLWKCCGILHAVIGSCSAFRGHDLGVALMQQCRKSMARIKYVLNERRLALLAATSPLASFTSPLAGHVPYSATGVTDPAIPLSALRGKSALPAWVYDRAELTLSPEEEGMLEDGEGDGEDATEAEQVADQTAPVVEGETVGKQEVESRDEGFGGGKEAKEFVEEVQVRDGHVGKK